MRAYAEAYLNDVVENQGKLFDFVAQSFPDKDTEEVINTYMKSKACCFNDIESVNKILYLIFDYPHKHYTFKHFEI